MTGSDAQLWERPELLAALASSDYGALLRAYRKWTGESQTGVGIACNLAQPDVSAIEAGRRQVTSATVQQRVLDGLGVPAHLRPSAAVVLTVPGGDLDEAQALELAGRVGASDVGSTTLDLLEGAFDDLACAYSTTAPRVLVERLRTHLAYVSRLLDGRMTLAEHRRLLVIGGWLSLLAATVHIDLQSDGAARTRLRTADALAAEARHAEIRAWVLETRAWRAVTEGDHVWAVELAEQAQAIAPEGSSARVQATAQQGRALARLGDADEVHRVMERVDVLVASRPVPERQSHHYRYDPSKFTAYAGTTLAWLGDPTAEAYARDLIASLSVCEGLGPWPRRLASARLDLSLTLLKSGELDEAADAAHKAIVSGHVAPSNYWRAAEVVYTAEARGLPEAPALREAFTAMRSAGLP
ncbi:helix-turn-helix domain-containing protein [Actinospica durhamensis]|uniref:Helix-turn-helix domain-containing protein n=1 Tax=Actinospica durhamensis TaxID=1508375 RepID=A0A941EYG7_9ACTN|nr:helix-turn-helix transcriptional regulator [Actinospica durhamensis]MBR7837369.1 helix-turn-helix domain-containing protein [Actinospica durhamensis]